jgi:hypothetical protein
MIALDLSAATSRWAAEAFKPKQSGAKDARLAMPGIDLFRKA